MFKDNLKLGLALGLLAPIVGLLIFKFTKFAAYSFQETIWYMLKEQGYRTLTAQLSVSLLLNALFFTLFINAKKDKTAKGIFFTTLIYGLFILLVKTFY